MAGRGGTPHLQLETNQALTDDGRARFVDWMTERYAETMETGTGHVAVTVRELDRPSLALGRAPAGEPVGLLNADVRRGRSYEQRRAFAEAVIDRMGEWLDVPREHCYVVYTEHPGEDFVLAEGPLGSWSEEEADPD